ncbi:natural resistance-associated macrophage protein-domain-containing protein [Sporodiniella umbellata]|nr:natural resistance-associated macrophage protein-domain-containing protein [Sporodiniella umbellata]
MLALRKISSYFKTLGKFIGPGFMVAVGYLDPGNWATDMEGGSSFGYRLLFIILVSNLIAVYLQNLTIRLGTITGLDLASASRKHFPRWLNIFLYVLAEIAIIATDLAEVIGSAIALNLLFPSLPLPAGVAITAVDVFIILLFYNEDIEDEDSTQSASGRMVRIFESFVMLLVAAVGICFIIELAYSDIVAVDVLKGYLPTKEIFTEPEVLYVAIGIIGATVMPHNLYLHSFIVQSRCREWKSKRPRVAPKGEGWVVKTWKEEDQDLQEKVPDSTLEKSEHTSLDVQDKLDFDQLERDLKKAVSKNLHYGFVDLIVALTFAFFVNCAILVVASANFYYSSNSQQVQDLFSAHALLMQYLGPPAAVVFALALLFAGQSSTLTATLAGQVIMSGFLGMTTRPWIRRIVTRLIAIIPAMVAACLAGRSGLSNMLVGSQVALSIQLPFAVVPLVYLTSRRSTMRLELVLHAKEQPLASGEDRSLSLVDRLISRFRFSKSTAEWSRFSQFNKLNQTVKNYFTRPNQDKRPPLVEQEGETLDSLPTPLTYPNGKISLVFAILISLLLIGLNGYMVVALFLQH